MEIRHATVEDAEELCEYLQAIVGESENLLAGPGEAPWTVEGEREILAQIEKMPNGCLFVAIVDGRIVGTAGLKGPTFRRVRHAAELGVTVRRSHWRQGIGRALSRHVIDWARKTGTIRKIDLRTRADNHGAIALYEQLGFEREGVLRRQWKFDDGFRDTLCMGLLIDRSAGEPEDASDLPSVLRITGASETHLDGVLEILLQVQALHHELEPTRYLPADRAGLRAWLAASLDGNTRFLVATVDDRVVGFAGVQSKEIPDNPFVGQRRGLLVDQLAVRESFRGRGVGRALMEAVESRARQGGYDVVILDTHALNRPAHGFFDHLGYQQGHQRRVKPASVAWGSGPHDS